MLPSVHARKMANGMGSDRSEFNAQNVSDPKEIGCGAAIFACGEGGRCVHSEKSWSLLSLMPLGACWKDG